MRPWWATAEPGGDYARRADGARAASEERRVPLQQVGVALGALAGGDRRRVAGLLLQAPQRGHDLAAALLAAALLALGPAGGAAVGAVVVGEEGRGRHPGNGSGPPSRHSPPPDGARRFSNQWSA